MKYLDDEEEWMLIICDVDVKECIEVVWMLGRYMVKLMVWENGFWNLSGNNFNISL